MSTAARSFKPLYMASLCAAGALACYLVSLNVASERAKLEAVEHQIVMAQREVRLLQTEIGTRGRLSQLERWNVKVLALSAPSADQFLKGGFELARLARPEDHVAIDAPIVFARAETPEKPDLNDAVAIDEAAIAKPVSQSARTVGANISQASLSTGAKDVGKKSGTREVPAQASSREPLDDAKKSMDRPTTAASSVHKGSKDSPGLAAAKPAASNSGDRAAKPAASNSGDRAAKPAASNSGDRAAKDPKKTVDKTTQSGSKPMTKAPRLAKADPLAPLPEKARSATQKDPIAKR